MYLDDGLGRGDNFLEALKTSNKVKSDLDNFRFAITHEKCYLTPMQKII